MTCLTCRHLDLQQYKQFSAVGLGKCCLKVDLMRFEPISSPGCDKQQEADAEIVARRVEWANKRRGQNK